MGRRKSSKYLYWTEVKESFSLAKSILVYQHFPRENRTSYIQRRVRELDEHTSAATVFALETSSVLFLLAVQHHHVQAVRKALNGVIESWNGQIREVAAVPVSSR